MEDSVARLPPYSVVMPNFNHARYLEAALDAHLGQSVPPLEIVVVDDASSDGSAAIVERRAAAHPSLRLIPLARNGGVNAAINRGLRAARGTYVKISAADDVVGVDLAARSLEILARYPAAGFSSCDAAVLLGDSGTMQRFPQFVSDRPCLLRPDDIVRLARHNLIGFSSNTVLYRRDALLAAGGFIEDLGWLADSFANYVLAFRHGACYLPEALAWFRLLPDSYSARAERDTAAHREALGRVMDLLETPAFHDVAPAFRASTIVAFMTPSPLRTVPWLLATPRYRRFLTPRLAARLLCFGPWSVLRRWIPQPWRRTARRLAARPMRRLAGRRAHPANEGEGR
jgi:glycosyltransferase involved in cell wall biosynthesis